MSASAETKFDDVMVAMDVVDTIRHEKSLVETELSGDARRDELVAKLRDIYRAQGLEVSDDILQKGVAALEERRFVHETLKPGLNRTLATIYVRRGKYAFRSAVAAVAIIAGIAIPKTIYHYAVVAPKERAAAELNIALSERLPRELNDAVAAATLAARDVPNADVQLSAVERAKQDALAALAAREADKAGKSIAAIVDIRKQLESRAASAIREREAKAAVAGLTAEATAVIADARAAAKEPSAVKAVETLAVDLERVAKSGDRGAFATAKAKLMNLTDEIKLPLTIKIVDRPKVMAGVFRMRNNDPKTKVFYLVVEALRPDGTAVPRQIRNVETDRTETVSLWAIRVSEGTYQKVAADKKNDGFINEREVGTKPAGALDIVWSVTTGGETITKW